MKTTNLIKALKSAYPEIKTDGQIAKLLGVTPGRISQWRANNSKITPRQVVAAFKRVISNAQNAAYTKAIRPIVELYPLERTPSREDVQWEILPTKAASHPRQFSLRQHLEKSKGIYFFYNSEGEVIYSGKTEKQTLWREMNNAYNRERTSHTAFLVDHPTTGKNFQPAWEKLRQPTRQVIYLYDVAAYFSVYNVAKALIPSLEALIVRGICNDLSNVRMERFKFDT